MKLTAFALALMLFMSPQSGFTTPSSADLSAPARITQSLLQILEPEEAAKIQVALLLDVSGSMDGLIEQAKAQLWKMVNTLAVAKFNGKSPDIEIALYEYGKDDIPAKEGYVRQLVSLSTDLDLISEKLFALYTNGGEEYCGAAIKTSLADLKWSKGKNDLKIIIIAGNEPFNQGNEDFRAACKNAIKNGVIVNTIFCGECEEGVRTFWKEGADLADGKYMCINQNTQITYIETPFDEEIGLKNKALNETYIGYGSLGESKKEAQAVQDANAATLGAANMSQRAAAKASQAYSNESWDLVDAVKEDKDILKKLKKEDLPALMKNMSEKERETFINEKSIQRDSLQASIKTLNEQREKFIADARREEANANTLDDVMIGAIRTQATAKGYEFEK